MPERWSHGVRARYLSGCLCLRCRAANATYERQRVLARAKGQPGWKPSDEVRQQLEYLQASGLGSRQIAVLSGCSRRRIQDVLSGAQQHVHPTTAAKLLSLSARPAGGTLTSAWQTKRWIRALQSEGFNAQSLARRLGLACQRFTVQTTRVRRSTAQRVQQLYRQVTAE